MLWNTIFYAATLYLSIFVYPSKFLIFAFMNIIIGVSSCRCTLLWRLFLLIILFFRKVYREYIDPDTQTSIPDCTYDVILCCAGFFQVHQISCQKYMGVIFINCNGNQFWDNFFLHKKVLNDKAFIVLINFPYDVIQKY